MALIKCPECTREISDRVKSCPHCGYPFDEQYDKQEDVDSSRNNADRKYTEPVKDSKRTLELVLGLLGGIGGLFSGVFAILFGGIDAAFSNTGTSILGSLGIGAIIFSIIGIVGAISVKKNGKIGGLLMTLAAIGGFISVFVFYIIPGILLIIPGIMSLKKPIQQGKEFKLKIWIPGAIGLVILVILISMGGSSGYEDDPVSLDEVEKYSIGDNVEVGQLTYIIKNANATKTIQDEFSKEEAQGIFLIFDVEVINNDKKARTIDTSLFNLVLEDGTKFEPTTSMVLEMNGMNGLFLEQINPSIRLEGYIIFDVPNLDNQYLIELSSGMFDSNLEYIEVDKNLISISKEEIIDGVVELEDEIEEVNEEFTTEYEEPIGDGEYDGESDLPTGPDYYDMMANPYKLVDSQTTLTGIVLDFFYDEDNIVYIVDTGTPSAYGVYQSANIAVYSNSIELESISIYDEVTIYGVYMGMYSFYDGNLEIDVNMPLININDFIIY